MLCIWLPRQFDTSFSCNNLEKNEIDASKLSMTVTFSECEVIKILALARFDDWFTKLHSLYRQHGRDGIKQYSAFDFLGIALSKLDPYHMNCRSPYIAQRHAHSTVSQWASSGSLFNDISVRSPPKRRNHDLR